MHVFVATSETQGSRADDHCWTLEGELVMLPALPCSDERCGCQRSFIGFASARATTTAQVIDHPELDGISYVTLFREALDREGWLLPGDPLGSSEAP